MATGSSSDTPDPTRGRWGLAAAAVLLQLALGAVYAWSTFSKALQSDASAFDLSKAQAALPFSVTIAMIFLGTYLGGRIQDVRRPRVVAGFGLGLGLGYIVPVAMLQKWFPDKRGLITGIAVGGFGFGAVLTSPIAQWLVARYPEVPTRSFLWLGVVYLVMTSIGASFFRNPPAGYQVPGWVAPTSGRVVQATREYTPGCPNGSGG